MPTSNSPFTYANNADGVIHLFILVYSGDSGVGFPTSLSDDDQEKACIITTSTTGTTPHFKHYQFNVSNFNQIVITCGNHIRTISIQDFDNTAVPTLSGDQAFDVPYCFSRKTSQSDPNRFDIEVILFSQTAQTFKITHNNTLAGTDTESVISTDGTTNVTEIFGSHTFTITDFMATTGAHTANFTGGKKKSRTKNIYHSPTPNLGNKKVITSKPAKKKDTLSTKKTAKPKTTKP
jgi:hypothetical protein